MSLMPILVSLCSSSWAAGTAIWLDGTPDPSLTPGLRPVLVEQALPSMRWGSDDDAAAATLAKALADSRPLLDVFDGELQILRDLEAALAAVEVIRPEDRDLVWQAELLQGLAAWRYFGDSLETEPEAAPFVARIGGKAMVSPWRDAIALDPDRVPTEADLADEGARLAYQEARAQLLLEKPAIIARGQIQPDVRFMVNGKAVDLEEARLSPGTHRAVLETEGNIRVRLVIRLESGERADLSLPASTAELAALAGPLGRSSGGLALSNEVLAALRMVEGPVELVLPDRKAPRRFEVQNGAAVIVASKAAPRATRDDEPASPGLRIALAGAWIYDGDYLLQNLDRDATSSASTVNAVAPMLSVAAELPLGPAVLGLGVDAALPLGTWHSLPSGETTQRLRAYPHLQAGLPFLRATAGVLTPWHVGLGARASLPLTDAMGIEGGYVHGLGLTLAREEGLPSFEPSNARMGWLGVSWRLGS